MKLAPLRKRIAAIADAQFPTPFALAQARRDWGKLMSDERLKARLEFAEHAAEGRASPAFLAASGVEHRRLYDAHYRPAFEALAREFAKTAGLKGSEAQAFVEVAAKRQELSRIDAIDAIGIQATCGELREVFRHAHEALSDPQFSTDLRFMKLGQAMAAHKLRFMQLENLFAGQPPDSPALNARAEYFDALGNAGLVHSLQMARLVDSGNSDRFRDMVFELDMALGKKLGIHE